MREKVSKRHTSTKSLKGSNKVNFYKDLIADLIFECRAHAGKSQKEFGELIDTNQKGVARLESGNHFPRIETLVKIAFALNCELIPPRFNFVRKSFFDGSWMLDSSLKTESSAPETCNQFIDDGQSIKLTGFISEPLTNKENANKVVYVQA